MSGVLKSLKRTLSGNHDEGEEIDTFESTPRRRSSSLFSRKSAIDEYATFDDGKPAEEYHENSRRRSGSFSSAAQRRPSIEKPSDMPAESLEERRRSSDDYASTHKYPPTPTTVVHLLYPPHDADGFGFILKRIKNGIFIACASVGSPAAECGATFGDEIVTIERRSLQGLKAKKAAELLKDILAKYRGQGGAAPAEEENDGHEWGRKGSVGKRRDSASRSAAPNIDMNKPYVELGLRRNPYEAVHELTYKHEPLGIRFVTGRILEVKKGSPAERAGMKANRFITAVDGRVVVGLHDRDIYEKIKANTTGSLTIRTMSCKKFIKLAGKINRAHLRFGLDHSATDADLRRRASYDEQMRERQIQEAVQELKRQSISETGNPEEDNPNGYEL